MASPAGSETATIARGVAASRMPVRVASSPSASLRSGASGMSCCQATSPTKIRA